MEVAPKSALEAEILTYMTALHPARVSVERLVSGAGVAALYDFYAAKFPDKVDTQLDAQVCYILFGFFLPLTDVSVPASCSCCT